MHCSSQFFFASFRPSSDLLRSRAQAHAGERFDWLFRSNHLDIVLCLMPLPLLYNCAILWWCWHCVACKVIVYKSCGPLFISKSALHAACKFNIYTKCYRNWNCYKKHRTNIKLCFIEIAHRKTYIQWLWLLACACLSLVACIFCNYFSPSACWHSKHANSLLFRGHVHFLRLPLKGLHIWWKYRRIIFRQQILFTIFSKNLTDFSTQQYGNLKFPFKSFIKMIHKRTFLKIINL